MAAVADCRPTTAGARERHQWAHFRTRAYDCTREGAVADAGRASRLAVVRILAEGDEVEAMEGPEP